MTELKPLRDKVIGQMVDTMGAMRQTESGIFLGTDDQGADDFVRPRWFLVTHVGPEQEDVHPGDYVLVPHGRWGHGFNLDGSLREEDKLFHIDTEQMMMVSDEPVST
jgi:hypothetical protein